MTNTKANRKQTKLPIIWSSKIPQLYKRNALIEDLH